jgi:hypothetical protein
MLKDFTTTLRTAWDHWLRLTALRLGARLDSLAARLKERAIL